ncbi:DUF1786 domain-containing protein [Thermoflexus sp.]|uniref:DUF1786 domain-containing protein n=1 Tax=Thermoflexus sp. TaxID=1969742 RepID=UPI0025DCE279|nr:DUF1786 domain-containing protein [Thermoflexus sp.]MDW8065296.1 DUF1786 domain-containing protein [Anaerolineae bacterium]MCS6963810.1 DUF1786 domain-containing protein [Thermoflexus sp.]MCS7349910.1 DUF1786 domain-containing protein [Thermoflexus sp.]MCX7691586.1 DUF1786 domain-containing protein [Thermoflexus sp.]MDW8179357.1 DUF1786 domain-containing protein [Anaerolineae bacterium]
MKILCVDIGTGTQDILLYDSRRELENAYQLILPSPTIRVAQAIRQATRERRPILLTGVTMGGGPCHWAAEDHLRMGLPVYATPEAARTFNDDLDAVQAMGVQILSEDEAARMDERAVRLVLRDFDWDALRQAFAAFDIPLRLDGIAVAVFDHGAAPPGYSDRKFRFDYLTRQLSERRDLTVFAHRGEEIPPALTRLQAVVRTIREVFEGPVVGMDTAPAAVLGATLDPRVAAWRQCLVVNVGNFHTLAFRLRDGEVEGLFEHHTGLLNGEKLDRLLHQLAEGALDFEEVFGDMGHGALMFETTPIRPEGVAVVGPRRGLLRESRHPLYFAVPYGDMMLTGCFGLLRAFAALYPEFASIIMDSLGGAPRPAPWEMLDE